MSFYLLCFWYDTYKCSNIVNIFHNKTIIDLAFSLYFSLFHLFVGKKWDLFVVGLALAWSVFLHLVKGLWWVWLHKTQKRASPKRKSRSTQTDCDLWKPYRDSPIHFCRRETSFSKKICTQIANFQLMFLAPIRTYVTLPVCVCRSPNCL